MRFSSRGWGHRRAWWHLGPVYPLQKRRHLERFRFRRNHTKENTLRCTSSTGSVKVGIALALQLRMIRSFIRRRDGRQKLPTEGGFDFRAGDLVAQALMRL